MNASIVTQLSRPYARIEVPAIGRVLEALWAKAEVLNQSTLQISNRALANEAGLASAGRMPKLLRQLEADGHLTYDAITGVITLTHAPITAVINDDQMVITAGIDPTCDQSHNDSGNQPHTAAARAEAPTDHSRDRQKSTYKVHESRSHEEEESCATAFFDWLLTKDGMRRRTAQRIIDSHVGQLVDFQTDLEHAEYTPGVNLPLYFVVARWLSGERVPVYVPPVRPSPPKSSYRRGSSHMPRESRGVVELNIPDDLKDYIDPGDLV